MEVYSYSISDFRSSLSRKLFDRDPRTNKKMNSHKGRDTCSWKGQLENFKLESLKLESFAEVGKSQAKLERTERSSKEPIEVR